MVKKIMRLPAVLDARGKRRSSHYNDVTAGLFTRPVKIGPRASGWPESEVAALQAARIAGRSDDEIRALVRKLEADRQKDAGADVRKGGTAFNMTVGGLASTSPSTADLERYEAEMALAADTAALTAQRLADGHGDPFAER